MSLDTLYGVGTAATFAQKVSLSASVPGSTASITEADMSNGGVNVDVIWRTKAGVKIGQYTLEFHGKHNHCSYLGIEPAFRNKGLLLRLLINMEPWWTDSLGIVKHTMGVTPNSHAEKVLKLSGFHEFATGEFGINAATRPRIRELIKWAAKGADPADEPTWRTTVKADVGQVEQVF